MKRLCVERGVKVKLMTVMVRNAQRSLVLGKDLVLRSLVEQRCEFKKQMENKPAHTTRDTSRHL